VLPSVGVTVVIMFERQRAYPSAVTASSATDPTAAQRAVNWVLEQLTAGQQVMIVFPGRQNAEYDPVLRRLADHRDVVSATRRTLHREQWRGGPVISAWPTAEDLAELADHPRVTALCVVPWAEEEVAAWVNAVNAEPLGEAAPGPNRAAATIGDPVIERAMTHLSAAVNHNNNLIGSFDKDLAVAGLTVLHDGGHRIDPDELYAWALAHGWPGRGAARLKEYAGKIAAGTRMRVHRQPLRAEILEIWRSEASTSD
jgi:hypothetical protein